MSGRVEAQGKIEMTELLDEGAAAISAAVRTGKLKARDVAEAAIARVEVRNKDLTAIVDFNPAEARAAADAVDAKRKQGFDGPILGVPYTVKDTTWVKGRRVTNGSLLYKDFLPPRDALAVERLKNAGGVFIGMTNTPEMAAKGHTENKVYGPSRNPANTALTPGGSSGGAAAADRADLPAHEGGEERSLRLRSQQLHRRDRTEAGEAAVCFRNGSVEAPLQLAKTAQFQGVRRWQRWHPAHFRLNPKRNLYTFFGQ